MAGPRVTTDHEMVDSEPESPGDEDPIPSETNTPSWLSKMLDLVDSIQETIEMKVTKCPQRPSSNRTAEGGNQRIQALRTRKLAIGYDKYGTQFYYDSYH